MFASRQVIHCFFFLLSSLEVAQGHGMLRQPASSYTYGLSDATRRVSLHGMGCPDGCNTYEQFLVDVRKDPSPYHNLIPVENITVSQNVTGPDGADDTFCNWKQSANFWFNQGTQINCIKATGTNCNGVGGNPKLCCPNDPMVAPTLTDPSLQTSPMKISSKLRGSQTDPNAYNPWRAPGHAGIADPCGILGGWEYASPEDYIGGPDRHGNTNANVPPATLNPPAGTFGTGALNEASKQRAAPSTPPAWKAGSVVEVSWSTLANHGGGYQYRLCPKEQLKEGEDCFQKTPLEFASEQSWIQRGANRTAIRAVRVSDANSAGVKPSGSTWTKNPLPECQDEGNTCVPTFIPALPGLYGQGSAYAQCEYEYSQGRLCSQEQWDEFVDLFNFTIVDEVKIPTGLEGEYVLSWRWDSETTAQVWANCADVVIERS